MKRVKLIKLQQTNMPEKVWSKMIKHCCEGEILSLMRPGRAQFIPIGKLTFYSDRV